MEWSTFEYDGRIISVNGVDSAYGKERGQNEILAYDPKKDKWKILGYLPHEMTSTGAKAIGNTIYIFGGGGDDWLPVNRNTYESTGLLKKSR